jgi:hypothetical protein
LPFPVRLAPVIGALAMILVLATSDARAQTVQGVLEGASLFGTWSADCSQPSSPAIPRSIFVIQPDGSVMRQLRIGPEEDRRFDYTIASAQRVDPNQVQMRYANAETVFDIVLEIQGERYRAIRSTAGDGTKLIENGILIASGRETIWQQRCDK